MPEYKLRVLKMGESEVPGPEVYWQSHWFSWETLHYYMVVIQGDGITAIINTGPPPDLTALNECWMAGYNGEERTKMRRAENERPDAALASVGINVEDIQYVFITPIQAYAIGNVSLFSAAKNIFISRRGWIEDFFAPPRPLGFPRGCVIPEEQVIYLTTRAIDRVHLVGEEEEVLPGINVIWAGVHHRSSVAVSIPTRKGRVMVSDSFFKYGNIEKSHPLGLSESLDECYETYARIRREADIVLPLYDPEVMTRYPGGLIE
jgi:glyoxylase-like metal-dependent hydrolase (beta-lactamase superfamily II)